MKRKLFFYSLMSIIIGWLVYLSISKKDYIAATMAVIAIFLVIDQIREKENVLKLISKIPLLEIDFDNGNAQIFWQVYELQKDATILQMFKSLSCDLEKLCTTESKRERFCKKYPSYLSQDNGWTFFLHKKDNQKPATDDNLFASYVRFSDKGLLCGPGMTKALSYDDEVFGPYSPTRVVVPYAN